MVGTIVVSMAGDPGVVCTVAAPCTGDVAFSVAVTLAGVSVVGMWWMPLSALWAGVGFAVVSAGFDPSTPGRYAAVVAGFVAVALGAFVMALRGRQATVAQSLLAVGVQPWAWSPVAAAVQPRRLNSGGLPCEVYVGTSTKPESSAVHSQRITTPRRGPWPEPHEPVVEVLLVGLGERLAA